MHRRFSLFAVSILSLFFWAATAATAVAQSSMPTDAANDFIFNSLTMVVGTFLIFLILHYPFHLFVLWAYIWSADWMNRDGEALRLKGRVTWNTVYFLVFSTGYGIGFWIPIFGIGCVISLLSYMIPFILYVRYHNSIVDHVDDKVWTKRHLKRWMAERSSKVGVKVDTSEKDPLEEGLPIVLEALDKDKQQVQIRQVLARQSSGFNDARRLLCETLYRQGDAVMLDFSAEAMAVRHQIDGVWHEDQPWERALGDEMLVALKLLAGLKPEDRRGAQAGQFLIKFEKRFKYEARFRSQGTQTGERVVVELQSDKTQFESFDDLGLSPQQQQTIRDHLGATKGFIAVSAMPKNGLTSLANVMLRAADRFTRDFWAIEDVQNPHEFVENIAIAKFDSAKGERPESVMNDLFLKEPQFIVCEDVDSYDGESLRYLLREVDNDRVIFVSHKAKDCVDSLLRIAARKVPPAEIAQRATMIVNQRLIRKLCPDCKEAYQPDPRMLQQLGLPPDRVPVLYRQFQPKPVTNEREEEPPCATCDAIGYTGRTALFEILIVDDTVRKVLATNPTPDALRQATRKAGMRSLQQEGILLAARGITSLEEVQRVMKQ